MYVLFIMHELYLPAPFMFHNIFCYGLDDNRNNAIFNVLIEYSANATVVKNTKEKYSQQEYHSLKSLHIINMRFLYKQEFLVFL